MLRAGAFFATILVLLSVPFSQPGAATEGGPSCPLNQEVYYNPDYGRLTACSITSDECNFGDFRDYPCDVTLLQAECGPDLAEPESRPYLAREVTVLRRGPDTGDPVGLITFATGGGGGGFYEAADEDPMGGCPPDRPDACDDGKDTILDVLGAGYGTYQLNHSQSSGGDGRFTNARGLGWRENSCINALVVKWIYEQKRLDQPLCSTGNSGGGFELAYGLAYFDLETALDAAIPTGGPTTRWDLHAFGGADCADDCGELLTPPYGFVGDPTLPDGLLCWNTGFGCGNVDYFVNNNPRYDCNYDQPEDKGPACRYAMPPHTDLPTEVYVQAIQGVDFNGSVMNVVPGFADLVYPSTKMRIVVAADDPGKAQNFALIYKNDIQATADHMQLTEIGGEFATVHSTHVTGPGSDQIAEYLLDTCHVNAPIATISPARDNTLYETMDGSLSNGAGQHFFAGEDDVGQLRRGVIAFDIDGNLPAGSTITGVELRLRLSETTVTQHAISLHRLLANWGEGGSDAPRGEEGGAPSTMGDATWLHTFFNTGNWSELGGDYKANPSAVVTVDQLGLYQWGTTSKMVTDVQIWLDNPGQNFGWIVVGEENGSPTLQRFDSKDHSNPAARPALRIKFTAPIALAGQVPTGAGETLPLRIGKALLDEITLSWDSSCLPSDDDYEIYEGALGDFSSHEPRFCNTEGATIKTFAPAATSTYYLVVPRSADREGSYGKDHRGVERPGSPSACLPPGIADCQ